MLHSTVSVFVSVSVSVFISVTVFVVVSVTVSVFVSVSVFISVTVSVSVFVSVSVYLMIYTMTSYWQTGNGLKFYRSVPSSPGIFVYPSSSRVFIIFDTRQTFDAESYAWYGTATRYHAACSAARTPYAALKETPCFHSTVYAWHIWPRVSAVYGGDSFNLHTSNIVVGEKRPSSPPPPLPPAPTLYGRETAVVVYRVPVNHHVWSSTPIDRRFPPASTCRWGRITEENASSLTDGEIATAERASASSASRLRVYRWMSWHSHSLTLACTHTLTDGMRVT